MTRVLVLSALLSAGPLYDPTPNVADTPGDACPGPLVEQAESGLCVSAACAACDDTLAWEACRSTQCPPDAQ